MTINKIIKLIIEQVSQDLGIEDLDDEEVQVGMAFNKATSEWAVWVQKANDDAIAEMSDLEIEHNYWNGISEGIDRVENEPTNSWHITLNEDLLTALIALHKKTIDD